MEVTKHQSFDIEFEGNDIILEWDVPFKVRLLMILNPFKKQIFVLKNGLNRLRYKRNGV